MSAALAPWLFGQFSTALQGGVATRVEVTERGPILWAVMGWGDDMGERAWPVLWTADGARAPLVVGLRTVGR